MEIREAVQADNDQLLSLTRDCPMDGTIRLLIDRQPDFFSLLKEKGEHKVFVAVSDDRIIGSFALVTKKCFIDHMPETVGYLCDLKIHPLHRNTLVAGRLLRRMHAHMQTLKICFYLCVTARGNANVESLLNGRASVQSAVKVADFNVYQVLPLKSKKKSEYSVDDFRKADHEKSIDLLNSYYREFQFASVYLPEHDIAGEKAWVIRSGEEVTGFISVTDMSSFKQNVVIKIPFYISMLLKAFRLYWPMASLPRANAPIRMLYIKYFAFQKQDNDALAALLQRARLYAFERKYTFISYGIDERNPLNTVFANAPKVTFRSTGFVFNFNPLRELSSDQMYHDNFYQV